MIKKTSFREFIKNVKMVVGVNNIIVTTLAIISTYLCIHFGIRIDFPLTVITIAVVFPIVFTIGSAYKRREVALTHYGMIKSICRSIYFASRDWIPEEEKAKTDENNEKLKNIIKNVLNTINIMLKADPDNRAKKEKNAYDAISYLSQAINEFRERGMAG